MHKAYAHGEDSRTPPPSFSNQKNRCPSEYAPSSLQHCMTHSKYGKKHSFHHGPIQKFSKILFRMTSNLSYNGTGLITQLSVEKKMSKNNFWKFLEVKMTSKNVIFPLLFIPGCKIIFFVYLVSF